MKGNVRMTALYCMLLAIAATLFYRIYYLAAGNTLSTAAKTQSSYTLKVVEERGIIYDRNFERFTNRKEHYVAAVLPCDQSLAAMSRELTGERRTEMVESFRNGRPFLMEVDSPRIYSYGVDIFRTTERYEQPQPAAHIIGHLQDGAGAYGIEKAYESILSSCGSIGTVSYTVDARSTVLPGVAPTIQNKESGEGVVLTLDREIQKIAEEAAGYYIRKGAVVVMDVQTGDLLASVSLPAFNPQDLASSMEDPNQPFVNRAFSAYNVGSTFKLLTACNALDAGFSADLAYECLGYIEIGDVRFNCHKLDGHGWLAMPRAVEQSCNTYFINLGQKLNPRALLNLCENVGLSRRSRLAPQMTTASGTLPASETLQSPAVMANFSFGQGALTATPVQIAQLISAVANGGKAVTPRLVAGATLDGQTVSEENPNVSPVQVISPRTAQKVQEMMISTVEQGSGTNAKPDFGSAGGKTASAQTGTFREDGSEIVHAWFSGFYPAKDPRYAIIVLNEGGNSGGKVAAPVFKRIANGIAGLQR